jgi:hypothetical protein
MTKCRLGYVMLMQNVGKILHWPPARCVCAMCGAAVEDVEHFLHGCVVLDPCRRRYRTEALKALQLAGTGAQGARSALDGSPVEFVKLVLGGLAVFPAAGEPEDLAKAAWALDKASKNFLLACWRRRAHFVGHLRVSRGVLVREDATDAQDPASLATGTPVRSAAQLEACRPFWEEWIQRPAVPTGGRRSKGRSPFFVVLVGRRPGIYTSWLECAPNVKGFPGAKFGGYGSLAAAKRAWAQRDAG